MVGFFRKSCCAGHSEPGPQAEGACASTSQAVMEGTSPTAEAAEMEPVDDAKADIDQLIENNKEWVESVIATDPEYFERVKSSQAPKYLWIGCSDSRVVAERALGLGVGKLFVHRNVGNCLSHADQNAMSALEYSVQALGVKHILVCGHENCGAVKASLTMPLTNAMLTNCWISQIRAVRDEHAQELAAIDDLDDKVSALVEMNVKRQVHNVCTAPVVQRAWEAGQEVHVHGLVFDVGTGKIRVAADPFSSAESV